MRNTMPRIACLCAALLAAGCATSSTEQRAYDSPDQAAADLVRACRGQDREALVPILGEKHREALLAGDPIQDREGLRYIVDSAAEHLEVVPAADGRAEVVLGEGRWPFPFPLVRVGEQWRFDTAQGIDEVLKRRIGRNELAIIGTCRSLLDAQELYWANDWDGDGVFEYAQNFVASPGKYDGLYWVPDLEKGVPCSPLEGLADQEREYAAAREKEPEPVSKHGKPWYGYHGRMLSAQGENAPGGAKVYLEGENQIHGHAMVFWPDRYALTGVMTFLVSNHGEVLERDLGPDTEAIVERMQRFDPGPEWKPVEEEDAP